ncbi:MAG: decaprenyl-phosphate phosphoribosyltransferase [bacterium]|nr:decaprenyl-phosphate phosphoribosyltransferase [bacterium]
MLAALLKLSRPAHWPKNVFVLAPLVFAQLLHVPSAVARTLVAFTCFCAASSVVYIFNDYRDRHLDRKHPLKKLRPLAAGTISPALALGFAALLVVGVVIGGTWLGTGFMVVVLSYLALNALYSLGLKRVVILDVMIVSLGFVLRVLGGGAAISVDISAWLLLCTIFLALFLAFSKRRHELMLLADEATAQRLVLSHYSAGFLDQMINVVTASSVVSYALYSVAPETVERFNTDFLVYTMPFVLFGIFRYLYLMYQVPEQVNPTEAVVRDLPSILNILLWGCAVLGIVYFF